VSAHIANRLATGTPRAAKVVVKPQGWLPVSGLLFAFLATALVMCNLTVELLSEAWGAGSVPERACSANWRADPGPSQSATTPRARLGPAFPGTHPVVWPPRQQQRPVQRPGAREPAPPCPGWARGSVFEFRLEPGLPQLRTAAGLSHHWTGLSCCCAPSARPQPAQPHGRKPSRDEGQNKCAPTASTERLLLGVLSIDSNLQSSVSRNG
jgi:hypothetical protein